MHEYTTVRKKPGHLFLDLFRDGNKIGLVMSTPYQATLAIAEPGYKGTKLTPDEKIDAQIKAKKTML